MKGFLLGAVALASLVTAPAFANTLVLSAGSGYSATVTWNNDGTVEYNGIAYDAVQQQDKLFDNFTAGSSLAAGASVQFTYSVIGGDDHHSISFLSGFGAAGANAVFNWGYDISVIPTSPAYIIYAGGDVLQNAGSSTLLKDLNADTIDFTKTGSSGYVGNTSVNFFPGVKSVVVDETLTIGALGSDASGVSNTFIEAVPEPSTWAMMGLGFAGLAFAGFRSSRKTAAFVA